MAEPETKASELSTRLAAPDRFGRFAQHYVASPGHAGGTDLERLVARAGAQSNWLTLDVATGPGHTAFRLAPIVRHVVATDLSPGMLGAARRLGHERGLENVSFTMADAQALPFGAGVFDAVTCRTAAHHFENCERFVREAARVLQPDGLLLVIDQLLPDGQAAGEYVTSFERLRDPTHRLGHSEQEWVTMVHEAGLALVYCERLVKILNLSEWADCQGCTSEILDRLRDVLLNAPPMAAAWLDPRNLDSSAATFSSHQILIAGRKTDAPCAEEP